MKFDKPRSFVNLFAWCCSFDHFTVSTSSASSETNLNEMPPRRKRKAATREETKLKKHKDDCMTRCLFLKICLNSDRYRWSVRDFTQRGLMLLKKLNQGQKLSIKAKCCYEYWSIINQINDINKIIVIILFLALSLKVFLMS